MGANHRGTRDGLGSKENLPSKTTFQGGLKGSSSPGQVIGGGRALKAHGTARGRPRTERGAGHTHGTWRMRETGTGRGSRRRRA